MTRITSSVIGLSWMAVLAAGVASGGKDPVLACAEAKLKAAGKKTAAKLSCQSKAVAKGVPVDTLCLQKAETKFNDAFTKAESKGGCALTGDAASVEGSIDAFVGDVVAALPDGGTPAGRKCSAAKLKATGKKGDGKLKCHAKAAGKGLAVDPVCLSKIEGKFTVAFDKAEAKGGCATVGDAAAVEALVDAMVAALVGGIPATTTSTTLLVTTSTSTTSSTSASTTSSTSTTTSTLPVPTTTSTSSTSTTSTSTSTTSTTLGGAVCGDGVVEGTEQCDPPLANICQANCTWVPAVCGDGFRQFGETCDDGNTLDDNGVQIPPDVCPSDCRISTCPANATRVQVSVSYSKSTGVSVGSLTTSLKYPDGTVGIPGLGNATSVRGRMSSVPAGFTFTANDLDYSLRMLISSPTPGTVLSPGLIYRVSFDLCVGQSAPPTTAFTCRVAAAATSGSPSLDIDLVANPMTCSITIP